MAYIGNTPAEAYISISSQTFTTINGTDYVLSSSVTNSEDIALFLNNVRQKPSTYTATGTTLTMGTATTTADELYCVFLGKGIQTVNPPAGSVGTSQIADLAVTTAKLDNLAVTNAKVADDAVGVDELSATGTASASTYLRGDNSWAAVAADTNDKVGVSSDDTTPGYLNGKLVAGTNISLTEGSGGGDETLTAAFTGSLNASVLNAGTVATARLGSGTADETTFLRGDQTYAAAGGGKINQYQYTVLTDYSQSSTTTGTWIDVTNLNVSITPSATDSVIIIQYSLVSCNSGGEYPFSRVQRDIAGAGYGDWNYNVGEADGSIYRVSGPMGYTTSNDQITGTMSSLLKDSTHNTTSAITYKLQFVSGGGTFKVNRCVNATTGAGASRSLSWISAMEVLA